MMLKYFWKKEEGNSVTFDRMRKKINLKFFKKKNRIEKIGLETENNFKLNFFFFTVSFGNFHRDDPPKKKCLN